jgi:hypothetical protein
MLVEVPRARGEVPTVDTMGVIFIILLALWLLGVRIL